MEPRDEMVDGSGRLRPHWSNLLAIFSALGRDVQLERAAQLDRIFAEEGVSALLPGAAPVAWRCDPIPLPLTGREFAALEAGLAQRARLLSAVLADVYGPQRLLATGALPPAVVQANPAFLRAWRATLDGAAPQPSRLHFYAAELIRGPDGAWCVVADRTADAAGIGYALQNRRILARVMPELFGAHQLRRLSPFFELWQDVLQQMAPGGAGHPRVALLTPGPADKLWFEHVMLARELACTLVEGGDLTVRNARLYLKTMRGLQQVDLLLRRQDGRTLDPLEQEAGPAQGVPGLLDAVRAGTVKVVNDPGAGMAEAPALAPFLPMLCQRLLGETLLLPSLASLWLGEPEARARVLADLAAWRIRPALDGTVAPASVVRLSAAAQARLRARIEERPHDFVAAAPLSPSLAPCLGPDGLEPHPMVLRMFLLFDGTGWRAMPGGLARALSEGDASSGRLPLHALAKDVWVAAEEATEMLGPAHLRAHPMAIRRTPGDLPSRVADNFFWFGRYLERLEARARLLRIAITRLERPTPTPREAAELGTLADCLVAAGLMDGEAATGTSVAALSAALLHAARREDGPFLVLLAEASRMTGLLRDRLTGEVHAMVTQGLRHLTDAFRRLPAAAERTLTAPFRATTEVLSFTAAVAGLAAENMVRGGGRMFLDLGRRVERAWATAGALAEVLDQPGAATHPGRLEPGLRLALELCDSVITYRSRYLTVLQPAPVLDLVLADDGNPRGLAYQLIAARDLLAELTGGADQLLAAAATQLLEKAQALVADAVRSTEQGAVIANLPQRLRELEGGVAELSNRIVRHCFALLPAARSLGVEAEARRLRGMA